MEVVLGMLFLTFSNADIQCAEKKLIWRSYTTKEALFTTRKVEIINRKEFDKAALDNNIGVFKVHVSFLSLRSKMIIHPAQEAQIASLLVKKIIVPAKYSDFADIFSKELAEVLLECTGINKNTIKLEDSNQPPYGPIYSLGPVELKTLKPTSKPIWPTVSSDLWSLLLVLWSYLLVSLMVASGCASITEV